MDKVCYGNIIVTWPNTFDERASLSLSPEGVFVFVTLLFNITSQTAGGLHTFFLSLKKSSNKYLFECGARVYS